MAIMVFAIYPVLAMPDRFNAIPIRKLVDAPVFLTRPLINLMRAAGSRCLELNALQLRWFF
jgi:hypothetical protein